MKLSIANSPRVCAAAPDAVASARASATAKRPMRSAPERDLGNLALCGSVELEVLALGEAEE